MNARTLSEATPIAKKQYRCEWCGEIIEPGERHYYWTGIYDGFQTWRMHKKCKDALDREQEEDSYGYEFPQFEHSLGMTFYEMDEEE